MLFVVVSDAVAYFWGLGLLRKSRSGGEKLACIDTLALQLAAQQIEPRAHHTAASLLASFHERIAADGCADVGKAGPL